MLPRQPGKPSLLATLNDRIVVDLLLQHGSLTRAGIAELSGLSKVSASQIMKRLATMGMTVQVGTKSAGRGPDAAVYALHPDLAYVVGVDFDPHRVAVAVADVMGEIRGRTDVEIADADPAAAVVNAVRETISSAGARVERVRRIVLGTPGIVDPATGEITLARDIEDSLAGREGANDILRSGAARWRQDILNATRDELRVPTMFENDVNLASVAEAHLGVARDGGDFVLMWLGRGVGLSIVLGGRVHRGGSGAAGEIGYLPVAGASIPNASVRQARGPVTGFLQGLVGANAVSALAREHGFTQSSAHNAVRAAADRNLDDDPFLDALADRVARGVASVCVILDPPTVVLTGEVGRAGGRALADRVQRKVLEMAPVSAKVVPTAVPADPVLHGALLSGLQVVREELFIRPTTAEPAR